MSKLIPGLHKNYVHSRRTRALAQGISRLLPDRASVLDVGCGDGIIDALIIEQRTDVAIRGVDILIRPSSRIPVDPFDGTTLPCADKSYDVVSFIDVLHHTDDPMVLLREAKRVARKAVVLKDHTKDGPFAYQTLRFMDWVGNAHHGVALPYNYWTEKTWREAFATLGMQIARWQSSLGLYPFPGTLVFERGLHFIAVLTVADESHDRPS